ncbi:hypothetical protein APSETT445_000125 [Aspergillus pseudonomiae]
MAAPGAPAHAPGAVAGSGNTPTVLQNQQIQEKKNQFATTCSANQHETVCCESVDESQTQSLSGQSSEGLLGGLLQGGLGSLLDDLSLVGGTRGACKGLNVLGGECKTNIGCCQQNAASNNVQAAVGTTPERVPSSGALPFGTHPFIHDWSVRRVQYHTIMNRSTTGKLSDPGRPPGTGKDAGRPNKRRKIAVACDECRVRKTRCDGAQPGDNSPSASAYRSPSGRNAGYVSGLAQTRQRADGVNAMMGAVEEERPTQGFFGSSSAASFMHQIKMAVDRRVTSPHRRTSDTILGVSHAPGLMSTASERHFNIQNYVLPPRKTADSLMGVYWSFVFPLYPLVDGIGLRAEYEKVWTGEPLENDESMLMCTLNVIFALACQLADFIPPEEREASADAFFSRAKDLLQFNLWDTGSAALIQCLLLMAQYLQSTDSAHQCWIVTGLAIRNAQSLGLHLPQTIARLPSPQEQQLARKIWHGCVLMDRYDRLCSFNLQCLTLSRVISMTFGRPAMISKASCESVPLPATVDEEYIPTASGIEATQPADQPSVMAFYAKSLELYEIMNDILLSLYKPVPEESPEDMYDLYFNKETSQGERTIFELDRALSKWSQSLPSHLRGNSPAGSTDVVFYHQSVVLRARYGHVNL